MKARVAGIALAMLSTGCVSTAVGVVTLPVRAVGYTADKLTTSQAEADRNRGRKMRKQEERDKKAEKKREKEERKAAERDGD